MESRNPMDESKVLENLFPHGQQVSLHVLIMIAGLVLCLQVVSYVY